MKVRFIRSGYSILNVLRILIFIPLLTTLLAALAVVCVLAAVPLVLFFLLSEIEKKRHSLQFILYSA